MTTPEELIKAAARVLMDSVLQLIQDDPHMWSDRPCPTCRTISSIVEHKFGCYTYADSRALARERAARSKPV